MWHHYLYDLLCTPLLHCDDSRTLLVRIAMLRNSTIKRKEKQKKILTIPSSIDLNTFLFRQCFSLSLLSENCIPSLAFADNIRRVRTIHLSSLSLFSSFHQKDSSVPSSYTLTPHITSAQSHSLSFHSHITPPTSLIYPFFSFHLCEGEHSTLDLLYYFFCRPIQSTLHYIPSLTTDSCTPPLCSQISFGHQSHTLKPPWLIFLFRLLLSLSSSLSLFYIFPLQPFLFTFLSSLLRPFPFSR